MTPAEVKAWRERYGLTQTELGKLLGVHYATVQRWEHGERAVPAFLKLALATLERNLLNRDAMRAQQRRTRASQAGTSTP